MLYFELRNNVMLNSLNDIVYILFVAKRDNAHTLHVTVIKKALNFEYPVGLPLLNWFQ